EAVIEQRVLVVAGRLDEVKANAIAPTVRRAFEPGHEKTVEAQVLHCPTKNFEMLQRTQTRKCGLRLRIGTIRLCSPSIRRNRRNGLGHRFVIMPSRDGRYAHVSVQEDSYVQISIARRSRSRRPGRIPSRCPVPASPALSAPRLLSPLQLLFAVQLLFVPGVLLIPGLLRLS